MRLNLAPKHITWYVKVGHWVWKVLKTPAYRICTYIVLVAILYGGYRDTGGIPKDALEAALSLRQVDARTLSLSLAANQGEVRIDYSLLVAFFLGLIELSICLASLVRGLRNRVNLSPPEPRKVDLPEQDKAAPKKTPTQRLVRWLDDRMKWFCKFASAFGVAGVLAS